MKTFSLITALVFGLMISSQALAAKGGQPAGHGVDGKTYGGVVSDAAKSGGDYFPGDHASGGKRQGTDK